MVVMLSLPTDGVDAPAPVLPAPVPYAAVAVEEPAHEDHVNVDDGTNGNSNLVFQHQAPPPAAHADATAAAAAVVKYQDHGVDAADININDANAAADGELLVEAMKAADGGGGADPPPRKKSKKARQRKHSAPLGPHEALTLFAHKGIYVDEETGQLRTSANHKRCDKWDMYRYTRHFTFKVYKKYEAERLDDAELKRLMEAKARYFRTHPLIKESSSLLRRRHRARKGERVLTVDELRVQEQHWMAMWKDARAELRALREELRGETDEELRAELAADIEGLKRRKGDWAQLLGLRDDVARIRDL